MARDNKRKQTDDVIDEAQSNREELIAALARLEQYANDLHVEAERIRGKDNDNGKRRGGQR